jgi:hypothetical protein
LSDEDRKDFVRQVKGILSFEPVNRMATMTVITHGDAAKMEEVGDANPPLVTQTPAATILAPLISKTYDRQVPPEISGSSKVP